MDSDNKKMRIFIGSKSFGKYDQTAMKMLTGDPNVEIVDNITAAEGIVAGTEPYTYNVLGGVSYLKVISRMGVGYDNIDVSHCLNNNITVTYTPDAPSGSVAELTIAQILNLVRHIPHYNILMCGGVCTKHLGKLISELTIGVIGVGRIGQKVINRLEPFKPKEILAYDIDVEKLLDFQDGSEMPIVRCNNVQELLTNSDVVTVHVTGGPENKHLINDDFFSYMKDDSCLINTSRGSVLDEMALIRNLSKLCGVALDVFEDEPYHGQFNRHGKVLMTPHIGSLTLTARIAMETQAVLDCVSVLKDQIPLNMIPEMIKELV